MYVFVCELLSFTLTISIISFKRNKSVNKHIPDTIKSEEISTFVSLRKLYPHSNSQAFRGISEEWNDLRSAAPSLIAEVQVVIHLDSYKNFK